MRLRITRIAFLFHNVSDIGRARNFYEGVLGMKVGAEYEGAPGKWWIEYDVDGVTFAITNIGSRKGEGGALPTFEVADIEAAAATLRTAGAKFIGPVNKYPRCRSFTVADPDGNQIGFHQLKPSKAIPKFSRCRAHEVKPYLHAATGRTVAHRQSNGRGRVHLFSPTGFYVATESEKQA
jgi:predicted enzyme related to lactoylglutathione lyase